MRGWLAWYACSSFRTTWSPSGQVLPFSIVFLHGQVLPFSIVIYTGTSDGYDPCISDPVTGVAHAAFLGDLQAFESGPIRRRSSEYQAQISILSPQPQEVR